MITGWLIVAIFVALLAALPRLSIYLAVSAALWYVALQHPGDRSSILASEYFGLEHPITYSAAGAFILILHWIREARPRAKRD